MTESSSAYHYGQMLIDFARSHIDNPNGIDWWYGLPDYDINAYCEDNTMTVTMYPLDEETKETKTSEGILLAKSEMTIWRKRDN